jgi:hypothetical protein
MNITTVIMDVLYVHITWLPNNVSFYALLNISEYGHLITKLQNWRDQRMLCETYGTKQWSLLWTFGKGKGKSIPIQAWTGP